MSNDEEIIQRSYCSLKLVNFQNKLISQRVNTLTWTISQFRGFINNIAVKIRKQDSFCTEGSTGTTKFPNQIFVCEMI